MNEEIRVNGLTAEEWEELANPQTPSNEQLESMGIIQQPTSSQTQQPQTPSNKGERKYENLGYWETVGDEATAAAVELSKFFVPKKYELNYTPKTKAGDAFQTFSKYLYGISGLLVGGEAAAAGKGMALAGGFPKVAKVASGIEKVLKGDKFFKTTKTGLAALGVKGLNIGTQGVIQGAIIDATIHDTDEGRIADMFGSTNNKFVEWLQTNDNDSTALAKFKNVVDGALFSIGINGVFSVAEPLLGKIFRDVKSLKTSKITETEASKLTEEITRDNIKLGKIAETTDLVDTVRNIKEQAEINGDDASEIIINTLHPDNIENGQTILKMLDDGEDIFVHEDGTFDIKINKWEDAYKVSQEEYEKQLKAQDLINAETGVNVRIGDTALTHQDEAVRHTWTNRGWIGENEELNKVNANKIARNYKDKFEIDNNIKVEFVDGLTINGQAVEGNTSATKFLGKKAKNSQNAIDKKQLQVDKLQDKITMLEGGNTPVMDELEVLQEELRIATNELNELKKAAKNLNNRPDITIKIDKNARNPYATLRAELEHARDIAKGEVPKDSTQHFARYIGANEGEVAGGYTYKKSVGMASQNEIINGQNISNELQYNQEIVNNESRTNNIQGRNGNRTETDNNGLYGTRPSEYNERIQPYTRRSEIRSSNAGSIIHDPSPEFKTELETQGKPINSYKELAVSDEDTASFMSNFRAANEINGKKAAQVYEYSAEEYKQMKLFTAENGKSGFAIKQDGDIVSVFSAEKGSLAGLMNLAIQQGGKKLDCFDTILPKIYKKYGFVEVKRVKWNDQYKPANWDKEYFKQFNNGEPDVVYMELKQDVKETPVKQVTTDITSAIPVKEVSTSTPAETQQLKLDFTQATAEVKSSDELVDAVTTGKAIITQPEDVKTLVNKTIDLDPEISGTTWEAIAKDSDKLADLMVKADDYGFTQELTEALSLNDVTLMDNITRKVLAAQKLNANLGDKLANLGANPSYEQKKAVIDLIDQIKRYTKETGSASGRSLEARKLINKGVETFGSLRLSQLTKEGIQDLSDLLATTIEKIDLNFTRGSNLSIKERKQALIEEIIQNPDSPFVKLLVEDEKIAAKFDNILDELFTQNGKITSDVINDKLTKAITESRYDEVFEATKLTNNPETKARVVRNWCDRQGGLTSYYVHNLLSGVGTLAKNIISGGMNTLYFPAKKIIAGYLGGGETLTREGWNTYRNMLSNWQESWGLCKEAFLQGDGKLSMMKDTMNLTEDEVFNGFREWNFDDTTPEGIWHSIQNFHSLMTRAMGASDEFMSQLNYRSIMRAKAIEQAEKLAGMYSITDEMVKNNIADRLFKDAFDNVGRPTNIEALTEAKDVLYQLPLNGQIFDRTSGEMVQVRNQSWVSGLAQNLNTAAASNPLLKIMFPFVKTGANILQQNLEHNGIYAVLSKNQRELLISNTREGALARSQVAFGMFSFMTASALAMSGRITGSAPSDSKERKALFETGWKPYSIRIGNKYISYQGYEPIQTILGFAADCVNIAGNLQNSDDEAKWEKFSQQVLSTSVNNFLDKAAFRTGLKQLAFITSPDENLDEFKKALAQTAQGFLPNSALIRNASSLGKRSVTSPNNPYERMFNNYFNRGLGDYRRDVFGNRQDNYGLLVTNIAPDNADMIEYAELERLSHFGFNPSEISKTIHDTTLKYKDFKDPETGRSAYDSMQEELSMIEIDGKTLQEAVRELVESEEYQMLPDGVNMNGFKYSSSEATKINAVRALFVEYNNAALNRVIKDYGDNFVDKNNQTMSEAKEQVEIEKMNTSVNQGLDHNIINQLRRF